MYLGYLAIEAVPVAMRVLTLSYILFPVLESTP